MNNQIKTEFYIKLELDGDTTGTIRDNKILVKTNQ